MKKMLISILTLTLLSLVILSGCGNQQQTGGSVPANGTSGGIQPIKLALSPWPGWFVWYLVKEKGFFEKNGVNVELVWFPVYSDSLAALATGALFRIQAGFGH